MRTSALVVAFGLTLATGGSLVFAHCEIPCGIYGDGERFTAMAEDLVTIEKSMGKIAELSSAPGENFNQLARWVANKERHADNLRETLCQYFLAQRIKTPPTGNVKASQAYTRQLVVLHQMVVTAMKCKQSTDVAHVERFRGLLQEFEGLYGQKP
ncbi:MAG: superoxide dismutase [Ni] [Candidatus Latescibacteria bacterium]|nr:superoxide dismutase [Ni] [Candidatus Latescibacterota bacterium]